jgi:DNA gyrase subunit A
VKEEDAVSHLFVASTHSYILLFSKSGKLYWLRAHEIPDVSRDAKGTAIVNLVEMGGDKLAAVVAVRAFPEQEGQQFVVMATRRGVIKKTDLRAFSNPRAAGIIAMGVEEDDAVIGVQLSDGENDIFLGTRDGMAIRFHESDVRPMGRTAYGVRGITLREGDEVVAMDVVRPGGMMLTVTENGYGKRTDIDEYRVQSRGGVGIINIQTSERNGKVAGIAHVAADDELMLVTEQGKILRTSVAGIRETGRNAQGVRLMQIEFTEGDRVVSVARFAEKPEDATEDAASGAPPEPDDTPGADHLPHE